MGRGPRKRTKEELRAELVRDVTFVLNAPLTDRTKRVVCLEAFSAWTELNGKHKGCRFWSKEAFEAEPHILLGWPLMRGKNLRHEHAVPKKVLWSVLLEFKSPTEKTVRHYFDYIFGVVVTVEE